MLQALSEPVPGATSAASGPPASAPPQDYVLQALSEPVPQQPRAGAGLPAWEQTPVGRAVALGGRALIQGVAGLPMMAMDAGVAARNVIGDWANRELGRPATPDYTLPSQMWDKALDAYLPRPQSDMEKATSVADSLLAGGAIAPSDPTEAFQTDAERAATAQRSQFLRPIQNGMRALADNGIEGDRPGYVIPPSTASPTAFNQSVESVAGKLAMQQHASLANQSVTNALAKAALGVDQRVPLTAELPGQIRAAASEGYKAIGALPKIALGDAFKGRIGSILDEFNATASELPTLAPKDLQPIAEDLTSKDGISGKAALGAMRALRDRASAAFRAGDAGTGTAYRQMSGALEDAIDDDLSTRGPEYSDTLKNFRTARQKIAIAHTVEDAMNPATGNVVAPKLAAALRRGEPLSGPLRTAAEFANAAPRAVQEPTSSLGVSHLNAVWPALMGTAGAAAHGLEGGIGGVAAGVGVPLVRMAAQKALLSGMRQGALASLAPDAPGIFARLAPRLPGMVAGARAGWSDAVGRQ